MKNIWGFDPNEIVTAEMWNQIVAESGVGSQRTRNMLREAAQQAASGKTVAVLVMRQDQVPGITAMARDVLGPLIVGETSQGLVVGLGVIRFVSAASAGMTKPTWERIAGLRIPRHEGPILIDHHVTDSISGG